MDAEDLRDAMTAAGKAFADGLAANEQAKIERDEARAMVERRNAALVRLQNRLGSERRANRDLALRAVASYCSKVRMKALDSLKNDRRMPRTINYLERYNALLGMDDRSEVLRRLDQTISKADEILAAYAEVDVGPALSEAAASYVQSVNKLNGIVISAPEEQVIDETLTLSTSLMTGCSGASDDGLNKAIEDSFSNAFGAFSEIEQQQAELAAQQKDRLKQLEERTVEATTAAERAAKAALRSGSESIAGNVLSLPTWPAFEGSAILATEADPRLVRELALEVRRSFETFSEVVRDNGLFAAFASEGTFGACKGWRFGFWWDDFLYDLSEFEGAIPGRNDMRDISSNVEEDEGGDSLARSIERMREFNRIEYWGLLDDDFNVHVDAFWYGFKKLMVGINGLYRMNPASFNAYCNDIAKDVQAAVIDAGAPFMDAHQSAEFCKAIEELSKE